jgi:hypothetical protein
MTSRRPNRRSPSKNNAVDQPRQRAGEEFEALVERLMNILTSGTPNVEVIPNVMMEGPDGPRQVDVLIKSATGPFELTTIIDCKDYKRKVTVTQVNAWHDVMVDVNASKGALVSRNGFSNTAVHKAKRQGIDLFTLNNLDAVRDIVRDVPVHVRELRPTGIALSGPVQLDAGTTFDRTASLKLNDQNLPRLFRDEILSDSTITLQTSGQHTWEPTTISPPYYFRDIDGVRHDFLSLSLSYSLSDKHYFGYLSDLDSVLYFKNELTNDESAIFPAEAITVDYVQKFAEFDDAASLPVEPQLSVVLVASPSDADFASLQEFRYLGSQPLRDS